MHQADSVVHRCERIANVLFDTTAELELDHQEGPVGCERSADPKQDGVWGSLIVDRVEGGDEIELRVGWQGRDIDDFETHVREAHLTGFVASSGDGVFGDVVADEG